MSAFTHAVDGPPPVLLDHSDLARLHPHLGTARYTMGGETFSGTAEFTLPVSGQAIIAFAAMGGRSDQDLGENLVIEGHVDDVPFVITCPRANVKHMGATARTEGGWSLISPMNAPARIDYHRGGPAIRAVALLNNFDYDTGDVVESDRGWTVIATPFAATVGGRVVTFSHTPMSAGLGPLAAAGVIRSASLVECAFPVDAATDDDVLSFVTDVAGLCTIAADGTVGVAMLTLLDEAGHAVRRIVPQPVTGRYRRNGIVNDRWLSQFLASTYPAFVAMKQAHQPWRKLASYCGSLDDPPYLEQKFASLMMAFEFFVRNCLIEQGRVESEVADLDFNKLIGAARRDLGWTIPKHYTAKEAVRLWRNAIVHGNEWPEADTAAFRRLFDKWRLFLFRRVLIRLGYQGEVDSPQRGWASSSPVDDFSEEHNAFVPVAAQDIENWRRFKEHIKGFNAHRKQSA